ncbi:hypothetical protein LTR08_007477 [Meristemomyces frigidus]|nr:hypothetical protein LTR08_007477 [Meristemomyces frigidus]
MNELLDFLRTHEEAFRSRARLASLYSDFGPQRQTNPDGYHANATVWLRALTAASKAGVIPLQAGACSHDRFVLHTGALVAALQTPELGRPLALGAVLKDAVQRKELVPLGEFLAREKSVYARSWLPTPWQAVRWGLLHLGVLGREDQPMGDFVVMANVEAAAKAVIQHVAGAATSNTSRIFSRDLFASEFAATVGVAAISERDLAVLIAHLCRDHDAIAYDTPSTTVKFRAPSETTPPVIEHEDITIASLRTLITTLEPQVHTLAARVSELDTKAREAVTSKQLLTAKTALRQKKLAETKLRQRTATLAQVEEVYAKIEQAADQVEIVRIMEASSQTLRALNAKTGGVERVQGVMEGLEEAMAQTEEVSQAIGEVGVGGVDEGEVEEELEAMERAERVKVEEVERRRREQVEEAERREREKREEVEAEVTRGRLAELDRVGETVVTASADVPGEAVSQEVAL